MALIDWLIVVSYMACIVAMGYLVGRRYSDQNDYYLAGKKIPSWQGRRWTMPGM